LQDTGFTGIPICKHAICKHTICGTRVLHSNLKKATMATLNPYLNFKGNTEEAFTFYKSVFGGEFIALQRYKDTPEADKVADADKEKIMHIALPIGKGNILMATDALESMGRPYSTGSNFYLSLTADSEEEATKIFTGLSAGGVVTMPLQKTFWGAYFGMWNDKFGIQWMVNYDYNQHP
jgi:PhnB protein